MISDSRFNEYIPSSPLTGFGFFRLSDYLAPLDIGIYVLHVRLFL